MTKDAYMDVTLLSGLNHNKYGQIMNDPHNAFGMRRNEYPRYLTSAYDLAINWRGDYMPEVGSPNGGVAFYTDIGGNNIENHTTEGKAIPTRGCNPTECHI